MKKVFISFLIMTLMLTKISLVNISSVQAATTDTAVTTNKDVIKVSLSNIREIVIDNNLDLKIKDNELKIAKENREEAKDTYDDTTKPTKEEYTDYNTDGTSVFDSTNYESALSEYNSAKKAYETAKEAYKTAKTSYDKNVESVVYTAQQAYISYLNDLSTKKISEDTANYNEKKAQIYKLQYEKGFISKKDYLSKLQSNTSVNDLNEAKDTEELNRIKLCNTLGIDPEENIIFNTDITVDFLVISKINYEDDLEQMLNNNLDIELKHDNIDDLEDEEDTYDDNDQDDIYDYKYENAEIALKQAKNTAETDFKGKYNELMASYNSLKNSYDKILQEQNNFDVTEVKYDYGFISKNELDSGKITVDKDNASFVKARNECYLKYLKYIEMKEGY
ncbi:outer membrane efflux protein [Clostridium puniceum]|uniref:Outer membrane efflux protein n=1 Tax=Clostridium puniceum TaxID=29367 RepID=A0A1S8TA23_9CLOT|nr:TolC family protein [Clostridium puniceum]OOM74522.1 outer membrane efflux protein [Clostridium puniceum]